MEYPWPERRYYFRGGKSPVRGGGKQSIIIGSEPTVTEYRQFLLSAVKALEGQPHIQAQAQSLLSRGVPRDGEQG